MAPGLIPDQLAAVPGIAETGISVDFRQVPGASVSLADLDLLAREIEVGVAGGTDGVVITQGTDTIEESAYLLDIGYAGAHRGHRKTHATSIGAFAHPTAARSAMSPGSVDAVQPTRPAGRRPVRRTAPAKVGLVTLALDDGEVLSLLADRVDGLVIAGYGAGHVPLGRLLAVGADRSAMVAAFGVAGGYRDPADWPWPAR